MRFEIRPHDDPETVPLATQGRYCLIVEDDFDRETLEALQHRADEVRGENRTSLFREHELTIYLPIKQPPDHRVDTKASARPMSNSEPELIPSAERKVWAKLIKEEEQRSD